MKRALYPLILLLVTSAPAAFAWQGTITAAEWAKPRSGQGLIRFEVLQQAVAQLQADKAAILQIRYPGGDMGSMWASELKAWLVALGVVSVRIELLPGGAAEGVIELLLVSEGLTSTTP